MRLRLLNTVIFFDLFSVINKFVFFVLFFFIFVLLLSQTFIKHKLEYFKFFFLTGIIILLTIYIFLFYGNFYFFNKFNSLTSVSIVLIILVLFTGLLAYIFLNEKSLFKKNLFFIYFFIFVIITIGLVSTKNLLIMFLYFEFLFFPSLVFVYKFGYAKKTIKTIAFLMVWTFIGSLLVLVSILYLLYIYHQMDYSELLYLNVSPAENFYLFLLISLGFGIKIPLWPWYYWLTKVHVEAPTGFSIFLSGFLVKTAFYCFIHFYLLLNNFFGNLIVLSIVILGIIDSSIRMWGAIDIKRLIALATVQEMNLIVFLFLTTKNLESKILVLFLLVHGVLSGFFFFLIDQIQKKTFTRNLTSISGISLYMPKLTALVWVGLLIFRGFPIFNKFVIEWELLSLSIQNFYIYGIIFFFLFSFFGVIGFAKILLNVLYGQPTGIVVKYDLLKTDFILGLFFLALFILLNFITFVF